MFPLRDDNPTIHTSVATFTLIGLNLAAWIFLQGLGSPGPLARSICEFGLIPGELLQTLAVETRITLGQGLDCITDPQPDWLTPFTSMFMHGGWLHLIINMWFLYIFGDNVEDAMGVSRFVLFYLLCGLGAVAAQLLSDPKGAIPMVGASGAIGGVMGGYAMLFPRAPVHMLLFFGFFFFRIVVPAYFMLGYWFLLQVVSAIPATDHTTGGVAFWAHVGGFVTGIVLVRLFCSAGRLDICRSRRGLAHGLIERVR